MPKTRLLKADRQAITGAIIAHRFDPTFAEFDRSAPALAEEARTRAYGAFLRVMESAPTGAFPTRNSIGVTVDGKKIGLSFGEDRQQRRIFHEHEYSPVLAVLGDDPLGARILKHAEAIEAAKKERAELKATTFAMLENFYSFDALLESWPEAERFITARWRERGTYVSNVPVIALKQLTERLDLPPDEAEPEAAVA